MFLFSHLASLLFSVLFYSRHLLTTMKMSLNYMVELDVCVIWRKFLCLSLQRSGKMMIIEWRNDFQAPKYCGFSDRQFQLIISLRWWEGFSFRWRTFPRDMPCSSEQAHKRQSSVSSSSAPFTSTERERVRREKWNLQKKTTRNWSFPAREVLTTHPTKQSWKHEERTITWNQITHWAKSLVNIIRLSKQVEIWLQHDALSQAMHDVSTRIYLLCCFRV